MIVVNLSIAAGEDKELINERRLSAVFLARDAQFEDSRLQGGTFHP
jgi:hypothetical protein